MTMAMKEQRNQRHTADQLNTQDAKGLDHIALEAACIKKYAPTTISSGHKCKHRFLDAVTRGLP